MSKPDNVNHPSHYNHGSIEVIDAIEDWKLGFHDGNVVKYVARHKHKNGIEDLKKARWYLNRLKVGLHWRTSEVQVNSRILWSLLHGLPRKLRK